MPELPEVETIRLSLAPHLEGRRVTSVRVRNRALRCAVDERAMANRVAGRRITRLERRAKYLLVHLESGDVLLLHLGMSGRLTVAERAAPLDPHDHLLFRLAPRAGRSPEELRFRDPRRFGLALVLAAGEVAESPHLRPLGPEPLAAGAVDATLLRARSRRRTGSIKAALLDARLIAGVGNIYACESLYAAQVDPRTPANRLGPRRWARLLSAVREVLAAAIAEGGTSLDDYGDYRDGEGRQGLFQVELSVYGREGEPCPRCGHAVRRIMQSGRSTFFCARCQR
jgi:formamidopyrimidine-DNA glycosylase